ncbi:MAG: NAD(P)-dependent oxidoreductase [Pseudomonadota bacterium]
MKILVTGSSGHLGEGLVRVLRKNDALDVLGLDVKPSPYTTHVGSIQDTALVNQCMAGVDTLYHTATLHKPHIETHSKAEFLATNIGGTLSLLEAAVTHSVRSVVFTSTTSTFGDALRPPPGQAAAWVTEQTDPIPKNIYGTTKIAAEDLCQLFHRQEGLNCIILRTSRFFAEEDDNDGIRNGFADANAKLNEFLYRRVDLQDVVDAHIRAAARAPELRFGCYIVSATTPLNADDAMALNEDATPVVAKHVSGFEDAYRALGWRMFVRIDRVYVNDAARKDLGWEPRFDFGAMLRRCLNGEKPMSALAAEVGSHGYHDQVFTGRPYPARQ